MIYVNYSDFTKKMHLMALRERLCRQIQRLAELLQWSPARHACRTALAMPGEHWPQLAPRLGVGYNREDGSIGALEQLYRDRREIGLIDRGSDHYDNGTISCDSGTES